MEVGESEEEWEEIAKQAGKRKKKREKGRNPREAEMGMEKEVAGGSKRCHLFPSPNAQQRCRRRRALTKWKCF